MDAMNLPAAAALVFAVAAGSGGNGAPSA